MTPKTNCLNCTEVCAELRTLGETAEKAFPLTALVLASNRVVKRISLDQFQHLTNRLIKHGLIEEDESGYWLTGADLDKPTLLRMTLGAKTLKRMISLLKRIDDQAIFVLTGFDISCLLWAPHLSQQIHIALPATACRTWHSDNPVRKVGINLEWMMEVLHCTPDDAEVELLISDTEIHLNVEAHRNSTDLLDMSTMRTPVTISRKFPPYSATAHVPGSFFRQAVEYLSAINATALKIDANEGTGSLSSRHDTDSLHKYHTEIDCLTDDQDGARSLYGVDYLSEIVADIEPADMLTLYFGNSTPLQIKYVTSDGCEITQILSPRIETE